MRLEGLQRYQVWAYLAAIGAGLGIGSALPDVAPAFSALLWPALAALLYVTFALVPLTRLPGAFADRRFMTAVLLGNFAAMPVVAWALSAMLPEEPAVRLGVLLVLLVPCTDWFIAFARQGRGDTARALAATPVNLLVQLLLLPVYLGLFLGAEFVELVDTEHMLAAFALLVLAPLAAAWVTRLHARKAIGRLRALRRLERLTVPLLALVVFLVAASQVETVLAASELLAAAAAVFVAYLVVAALVGVLLGRLLRLPGGATRTLVFSLGSRNSFVVLPLALALPEPLQAAAVVIVLQSLVELFGMAGYVWAVPRWLASNSQGPAAPQRR